LEGFICPLSRYRSMTGDSHAVLATRKLPKGDKGAVQCNCCWFLSGRGEGIDLFADLGPMPDYREWCRTASCCTAGRLSFPWPHCAHYGKQLWAKQSTEDSAERRTSGRPRESDPASFVGAFAN
jgi:hypothetical protein